MGIIADGIESADDTAYRCASNDIDGDARLLQHFQHTDVRHTLCTAATEYDADFLSGLRAGLLTCQADAVALSIHSTNQEYSNDHE